METKIRDSAYHISWQLKMNELKSTGKIALIYRMHGIDESIIEVYQDENGIEYRRYFWRGSKWWSMN